MDSNKSQLYASAMGLVMAVENYADEEMTENLAKLVKLHAGIAAGSAFIPIPGAGIAAAVANTWTMYVRINKEVGLPFGENIIKSIASGVITNLGSGVAAALVAGSAFKLVPGLGSIGGGAIIAATVYGVTIAAGIFYMKAVAKMYDLEKGYDGAAKAKFRAEHKEEFLKKELDKMMKDKKFVKKTINDAKKGYKKD